MMEIIQFIAQDERHLTGAIIILVSVLFGLALVITSIGYAVSLARGFEKDGGNNDHDKDTKRS